MFLDGLDELDQQIVKLLIRNARMSYSEIGQKIGISRVAVRSRVQALEQAGIIEEYTGKSKLHVHAVASSSEEMEELMYGTMDKLPGVVECSCNMIFSRIKDIKGLRL